MSKAKKLLGIAESKVITNSKELKNILDSGKVLSNHGAAVFLELVDKYIDQTTVDDMSHIDIFNVIDIVSKAKEIHAFFDGTSIWISDLSIGDLKKAILKDAEKGMAKEDFEKLSKHWG